VLHEFGDCGVLMSGGGNNSCLTCMKLAWVSHQTLLYSGAARLMATTFPPLPHNRSRSALALQCCGVQVIRYGGASK
jgi:hypothetical protein